MSTEQETAQGTSPGGSVPGGEAEEPKLRRRPFGYSKRDVREALERSRADLGAREAELAELRQDIAALWLAFAQHDRMIRRALGPDYEREEDGAGRSDPAAQGEPAPAAAEGAPTAGRERPPADAGAAAEDAAIGRQLSDLDDVLAAIELATQTLERTYAEGAAGANAPAPDAAAGEDQKAAGA